MGATFCARRRWFAVGALVTGLAARTAEAGAAPPVVERRVRQMSEYVERDVGGGCEYRGNITGQLVPVPRTRDRTPRRFAPDLRVRAQVVCASGARVASPERAVRGRPRVLERIERDVERAATVRMARPEGRCVYTADVEVRGWAVEFERVAYACRDPRSDTVVSGAGAPR